MASRNFDLAQAAGLGITVLPDVTTLPAPQQVLAVKQIVDGNVETAFTSVTPVTVAATPPTLMPAGALWWDATGGQLYIRYDDGNSIQWVVANNNTVEGGPFLPLTGGAVTGPLNLSALPSAQPDGSPPVGAKPGDLYINGGFVCIAR